VGRITQQRHATIRNFLRFFLPRSAAKFLIDCIHVHEPAASGQAELWLGESAAPNHRDALSKFVRLHRSLQPFKRGVRHGGHQQRVRSRTTARTAASPGA